jgi:hypothetical protein
LRSLVDELLGEFVATLPPALAEAAGGLAVTLGLAPSRDVPWSEVFAHEVTLAGPALFAEAMPEVGWERVRDATLAHALAVLDAFASDRIADRQVEPSLLMEEVLMRARKTRDGALLRVLDSASYAEAALATLEATRAEHASLRKAAVPFDRYLAIARGKQRLGFPASLALARAAGWSPRRVACVAGVLDGITLGLQLHDDVIDWEDDLARAGSWAACLGGFGASPPIVDEQDRAALRAAVHRSGVLARMLAGSARHFRAARRRASLLGARRLAEWTGMREAAVAELAERERRSPGFANRAQALTQWSKTVLQ